jgi:hypothetical protein
MILANGKHLFDEVPEVLRDGWANPYPSVLESLSVVVGGEKRETKWNAQKVYENELQRDNYCNVSRIFLPVTKRKWRVTPFLASLTMFLGEFLGGRLQLCRRSAAVREEKNENTTHGYYSLEVCSTRKDGS